MRLLTFSSKRIIYILLFIGCIFIPTSSYGQIRISEQFQASKINSTNENSLYLVDFWATWCAPCITAKKYLEVLQGAFPDDLYVVSISQENSSRIKNFLVKNPTSLSVVRDYNGENFKRFDIQKLPTAALINTSGNVLWKGHPSDLKPEVVRRFILSNKEKRSNSEMIILREEPVSFISSTDRNSNSIFDLELSNDQETQNLHIDTRGIVTRLSGPLKDILSYTSNTFSEFIDINEATNKNYVLTYNKMDDSLGDISTKILDQLRLELVTNTSDEQVLSITLKENRLWDENQIDWGKDSPSFLIGELQIEADNVTAQAFFHRLSREIKKPIVVDDHDLATSSLHDWQLQYKYFDLMKNDLQDTYGIQIKEEIRPTVTYMVKKKPHE